jgi:hypothetical protein
MEELNQTTDYKIIKLSMVGSDGTLYDLRNIFVELNIYDTLLFPSVSGNIIITDAVGLVNKLKFDGSEVLLVSMGKTETEITYTNKFRVYKVDNRNPLNQTSEIYCLRFVSDEYVLSSQRKINQSYLGVYSDIATNIMINNLKLEPKNIIVSPSNGIKNIVVPNLSPIESLEWMASRAVNQDSVSNFLFFENKHGYNFVSLSDMMQSKEIAKINVDPKNLGKTFFQGKDNTTEMGNEFLGAREFKTVSQLDFLKTVKSGSYAGTFLGFDPITRTFEKQKYDYSTYYGKNPVHNNSIPNIPLVYDIEKKLNIENYDSKKVMYSSALNRLGSEYIKKYGSAVENNVEDNPQEYVLQRPAILRMFFSKRVKLVMPGNFNLTSGHTVLIKVPDRSRVQGDENKDESLYGKYTIISTRHIITYTKHETIFEACTDSMDGKQFNPPSTVQNEYLADSYKLENITI